MEVGNNKEMREALEKLHINFMCDAALLNDRFSPLFDIINHALAAPPRNCDVGTAEEQVARFNEYCRRTTICERCLDCMEKEHSIPFDRQCMMEWSQMSYEAVQEGDNNGSR